MLKRLIQWLKRFFQGLFGKKRQPITIREEVKSAPPLSDTDLEFLFIQLLEGVHQARGQTWAQKWLDNIEHRVSTERWLDWLKGFGEKLLASTLPNNEIAARLVQLGELGVGRVGNLAYDIGMQLLTRNQGEPIWEYDGPDNVSNHASPPANQIANTMEESPEGEYQTVTLDELLTMLEQDEHLRQQLSEQLGIDTDDPQVIVQALVNHLYTANEQPPTEN
jgi:hypothetical protein